MAKAKYEKLGDHAFDQFVEYALKDFNTPGLAVAVVHNGKTYATGSGIAEQTDSTPVTPRTLFQAASMSKSFTAAMAAHLVNSKTPSPSSGEPITWKTPLADVIRDDFVLQDPYATTHATIEDALSHRTGMPRHDMIWFTEKGSLRDQVRALRHVPLHNELRVQWDYCNNGFTSVAYAIAIVAGTEGTGDDFKRLTKEWIFDPLGMSESFYSIEDALEYVNMSAVNMSDDAEQVELARGHYIDDNSGKPVEVPFDDIPPTKGPGGIISNVLDWTKWLRHLMSKYTPADNPNTSTSPNQPSSTDDDAHPALSKAAVEAMTTPRALVPISYKPWAKGALPYGLGLYVYNYRDTIVWQHDGGICGYTSTMVMLPEHQWAVVTMCNAYSYAPIVVLWKCVDDFLDGIGNGGARFDMAALSRKREQESREKWRPSKAVQRLYPDLPGDAKSLPPSLPLEAYEGVYSHPAYGDLCISQTPPERHGEDERDTASLGEEEQQKQRLYLTFASEHAYMDMHATVHRVSGEHWWVHKHTGPRQWFVDEAHKLRFEVGVNAKVTGMRFQAEGAISGERGMALFEKIS